ETTRVVCCGIVNRGAALFDGKLYRTTLDAQVIALDITTRKEVWRPLRAAPAAQAARPQPPVLSVPCGAGWRPPGRARGSPHAPVRRGRAPRGAGGYALAQGERTSGRAVGGTGWADAGGGKGSVEKAV